MVFKTFVEPCNQQEVIGEFTKLIGCRKFFTKKEKVHTTAVRWSDFLHKMAIGFKLSTPQGESVKDHMVFDAGYNDNSGLAPILSKVIADDAAHARILVLIINQRDDHQMEKYFRGNEGYGGMFCDRDKPGSNFDSAFKEIEGVYNKSFEDIGGKYIRGKNEDNCVVRVPHTVFFEEFPPRQNRFPEAEIPDHVTYAYQEGATIVPNDEFYTLPEDKVGKEKVDILFLIANAPVETASMPETGSQKYTGLATDMKLAMDALLKKFPTYFHV